MRRVTLGLGISHGLLVAPGIPLVLHSAPHTPLPSISQAFPPRNTGPNACSCRKGSASPVFGRGAALRSPGDNRARRRSSSAQCGNQRSKHVGAVDLPDSVGEGGIGSLVTEKTVDGVGG